MNSLRMPLDHQVGQEVAAWLAEVVKGATARLTPERAVRRRMAAGAQ